MVKKELINYVAYALKSGKSVDEIKAELLNYGWSENEINQTLSMVQEGVKEQEKPEEERPEELEAKPEEKPKEKPKEEPEKEEAKPKEKVEKKKPEKGHKYIYILGTVIVILIMGVTAYYIYTLTSFSFLGKGSILGECGNGVCDPEENYISCPEDCEQPPPPPSLQKVSVIPATQNVSNGDTFAVEVKVSDASDLYGFQFDIEYDPNILQYEKIEEGNFLSKNGADTTYPINPEISSGLLKNIVNTRLGPIAGVNDEGVLETITFTALGTGTSEIKISNIRFVDSNAEIIKTNGENGQVTVS